MDVTRSRRERERAREKQLMKRIAWGAATLLALVAAAWGLMRRSGSPRRRRG